MPTHTVKLQMRVTPEQFADLKAKATKAETTVRNVVRELWTAEPFIDKKLTLEEALKKSERAVVDERAKHQHKGFRTINVEVDLSPEERDNVEEQAKAFGLERSEYLYRQVIKQDVREHGVRHGEKKRLDRAEFLLSQ